MIYYFVDEHGMLINEENNSRGYYTKEHYSNMRTTKKAAIKEARRQVKQRMAVLKERLIELEEMEKNCPIKKRKSKWG